MSRTDSPSLTSATFTLYNTLSKVWLVFVTCSYGRFDSVKACGWLSTGTELGIRSCMRHQPQCSSSVQVFRRVIAVWAVVRSIWRGFPSGSTWGRLQICCRTVKSAHIVQLVNTSCSKYNNLNEMFITVSHESKYRRKFQLTDHLIHDENTMTVHSKL